MTCDIENEEKINQVSEEITQIILEANISDKLKSELLDYYKKLDSEYVAVRSSALSEDGKEHAWAGQLETFLNIDEVDLVDNIKKCWVSGFSPRAIFYRIKNSDIDNISVAVVVQKMVQSDISGVAFSANPTTNDLDQLVIEAVLGLGEAIVSGKVTPDKYIVSKKDNSIKNKEIKCQKMKLVKTNNTTNWKDIDDGDNQKLEDKMIIQLSNMIKKLESFYGFPVDVEWELKIIVYIYCNADLLQH